MLGGYNFLNDTELAREIADYRAALKDFRTQKVASIAGEGRRVEFVGQSGLSELRSELRNLIVEQARREGRELGGSIMLEIG
jgi:hypothetical protein